MVHFIRSELKSSISLIQKENFILENGKFTTDSSNRCREGYHRQPSIQQRLDASQHFRQSIRGFTTCYQQLIGLKVLARKSKSKIIVRHPPWVLSVLHRLKLKTCRHICWIRHHWKRFCSKDSSNRQVKFHPQKHICHLLVDWVAPEFSRHGVA